MLYFLLALVAGLSGVLQSGLNKKIAEKTGLALALHLGNLIVLFGGVVVLSLIPVITRGEFAKLVRLKLRFPLEHLEYWHVVPGLCGLFFIVAAPYAIEKIGALKVFVGIICAQTIASFAWDHFVEHIPIDGWRITGCAFTLAGAASLSFSK